MKKYIEGIKFGMILQLIIGPMCLLVFHTSKNNGFLFTIPVIITIAAVDAFYITLACIGVSKLLENKKIRKTFQLIGSIILIIFGLNTILNVFNINIIPGLRIVPTTKNVIIETLLLALSNPITIMFWGSVLTAKIIEDNMKKKDLIIFCTGLVSATLIFQHFVALLGTLVSKFIPSFISNILNILIGLLIIYYGILRLLDKPKEVKKRKRRKKKGE